MSKYRIIEEVDIYSNKWYYPQERFLFFFWTRYVSTGGGWDIRYDTKDKALSNIEQHIFNETKQPTKVVYESN